LQSLYYLILVPMVYLAVAVFIIGTCFRLWQIFQEPAHPTTLQIYPEKKGKFLASLVDTFFFPTIRRHKPVLWVFLLVFHVGLILLFIGHLELIWELTIFQIIPHDPFLGKGFLGLILAICLLYFLFRRFLSPVKELSVPEDYYLLILLFIIVIFGSEMDWARRIYFYEELTVDDYREYFVSLLVLKPALPDGIIFSGHAFMLVLHVFFANIFLLFFPFSQSIHAFLSLPVNKLRRG
jgi:[DsrC]-trisulfide reductase subunit M